MAQNAQSTAAAPRAAAVAVVLGVAFIGTGDGGSNGMGDGGGGCIMPDGGSRI